MDELSDILKHRGSDQPPEIAAIKDYVSSNFQSTVGVSIRDREIIVTAASASLANALRMNSEQIIQVCKLTKRLVFRIG